MEPLTPYDPDVKNVRLSEDGTYVRWETQDGKTEGGYNLMYETDDGIRTLFSIMSEIEAKGHAVSQN